MWCSFIPKFSHNQRLKIIHLDGKRNIDAWNYSTYGKKHIDTERAVLIDKKRLK